MILRYTSKNSSVYAIVLKYTDGIIEFSAPKVTKQTEIELLGHKDKIEWSYKDAIIIDISKVLLRNLPLQWGLTFKLTNLL